MKTMQGLSKVQAPIILQAQLSSAAINPREADMKHAYQMPSMQQACADESALPDCINVLGMHSSCVTLARDPALHADTSRSLRFVHLLCS